MKSFVKFLCMMLLLSISNCADAVRLKGDGVKDVHRYVTYVSYEPWEETFEGVLKISSHSLYLDSIPEYDFDADKYGHNMYYYKRGMEGTPFIIGVTGIGLEIENLTNDVLVIKWSDSIIQLGNYDGVPFFSGMKYSEAGNPSLLVNTVIPPLMTKSKGLALGNPKYIKGGTFHSAQWQDGYAYVRADGSLQGIICLKVERNNQEKYYTFKTPHIILPADIVSKYAQS